MFQKRFNPTINPAQMPQQPFGMQQPQFGIPQQPFGMQQPQFGMPQQPFGMQQEQFGMQQPQFGMPQQPFGMQQEQFGMPEQPFGMQQEQFGMPDFGMQQEQFGMQQPFTPNLQYGMQQQMPGQFMSQQNQMLMQLISQIDPVVQYGIRQSKLQGIPDTIRLVSMISFLMGRGYDFQTALGLTESIDMDDNFPKPMTR